ncbi:hypothetical protein NDU88_002296 [Pleurodeles waltl]|uniref:Uncharacterized protein n=1 Tax=Pleurodeles waltl TaxID=8319 RepID=A0AAV7Q5K9_PLEWA|nr:hypothetical protein NDU88_002296 [Pleurodeles waltl]
MVPYEKTIQKLSESYHAHLPLREDSDGLSVPLHPRHPGAKPTKVTVKCKHEQQGGDTDPFDSLKRVFLSHRTTPAGNPMTPNLFAEDTDPGVYDPSTPIAHSFDLLSKDYLQGDLDLLPIRK